MCKSKSSILVSNPTTTTTTTTNSNNTSSSTITVVAGPTSSTTTTASSGASSSSLLSSLPSSSLALFPLSDLSDATNNFLSPTLPSSSAAWRCTLSGHPALLLRRPLRRPTTTSVLAARLQSLSKSHHSSLVPLLGAALADHNHLFVAYRFAAGANLADCLHNPRNPNFTPLKSWLSRTQVAADVAHGLDYVHRHSSAAAGVHGHLTGSAVIVSDDLTAKICYFGLADLAGEVQAPEPALARSGSMRMRVEGTRGYMAPELLSGGRISRQADVYAFGVLVLELVSGEEPVRYRFDRVRRDFERVSVVETAREAIGKAEEGEGEEGREERWGRVRRWVDRRLRDSFPVEAAERLIRVALRCVEEEAAARPEMTWVAGRISKVYLDSRDWDERIRIPTDITVSIAPR